MAGVILNLKTGTQKICTSEYSLENIRRTFFGECEVMLQNLEDGLTAVSNGEIDPDTVESIFISVGAIHEGASAFKFTDIENFALTFETTLDKMCTDQLELTHDVFKIFLKSCDMLTDIFTATRDGQQYDRQRAATVTQDLQNCIKPSARNENTKPDLTIGDINFQPIKLDFDFCNA